MNRRNFLKTTACLLLPFNLLCPTDELIDLEKNTKLKTHKGIIPYKATKHHKELSEIFKTNDKVIVKKYVAQGQRYWLIYL